MNDLNNLSKNVISFGPELYSSELYSLHMNIRNEELIPNWFGDNYYPRIFEALLDDLKVKYMSSFGADGKGKYLTIFLNQEFDILTFEDIYN